MNWTEIKNIELLEEIIALSYEKPIGIFKHSTRCSISAAAKGRLERAWDKTDHHPPLVTYYLDLLKYRNISNEIANKFDIEHESPQFILIKDGKVIYDASHFGIQLERILDSIAMSFS